MRASSLRRSTPLIAAAICRYVDRGRRNNWLITCRTCDTVKEQLVVRPKNETSKSRIFWHDRQGQRQYFFLPPPHGLRPCEGRAAGEGRNTVGEQAGGRSCGSSPALSRHARAATAPRTPPASGSPTPSGSACDCTPPPGSGRSAGRHRQSRGTRSRPLPPP
jgi:hypothetical protein